MPKVMQWLSAALPLTYYLRILRGVLLKGVGLQHLWMEGVILALLATLILGMSVVRFSKTIE
jgi:ABC-2 type transport system permease protein